MRYSSLALQVFLPMEAAPDLRQKLHDLILSSPEDATFHDKWCLYGDIGQWLGARAQLFEYGVWDYVEDSARAEAEFEKWCEGTVDDAKDAAEADGAAGPYRAGGGPRYMFVTLLFLMRRGGTSDRYICEVCRIPESSWWTKATFGNIVTSIGGLNFESVRADAVYVRPGRDELGVSRDELAQERYGYLKKLV